MLQNLWQVRGPQLEQLLSSRLWKFQKEISSVTSASEFRLNDSSENNLKVFKLLQMMFLSYLEKIIYEMDDASLRLVTIVAILSFRLKQTSLIVLSVIIA